jgi:hypothetical protein
MGGVRGWLRDPALEPFVWSRLAIWSAAIVFAFWLRPFDPPARGPAPGHGAGYALDLWANWDGAWFVQIARHSYATRDGAAAFYPLYTGLLALLGRAFGGRYVAAGVVLSLAAAAASFVLLRRLAALELGEDAARRATVLLAVFPLSFFLQAVYSESIFLALAVGAFLAARTGRWTLAGAAAAAAFLARPAAVALWAGLLVLAWQAPRRGRALSRIGPAPLAFALFPLLLWLQVGDPLAFARAERYWHREPSPLGPLGGVADGAAAAARGLRDLVAPHQASNWVFPANLDVRHAAAVNVQGFLFLVVFLVLTVLVWRRLGAAYGTFAALALALPLAAPWSVLPLMSLPRFGLVVFPFYLVLADLACTPRRYAAIVACSVLVLALDLARWSLWGWVA